MPVVRLPHRVRDLPGRLLDATEDQVAAIRGGHHAGQVGASEDGIRWDQIPAGPIGRDPHASLKVLLASAPADGDEPA